MKAIVYDRYGPPEVLRYADVERPTAGAGEVLVRVRAASLNFGDRAAMRGEPGAIRLAMGLRRPRARVLGRAVAGTVEAVGPGVTRFQPGDGVFGEVSQKGFAEFAVAKEKHLAAKPAEVSFERAATLPVAANTALQGIRLGQVGAGTRLLVNGASGGVGTFAVQLAKAAGAHITATCGGRNSDLVRSIGADRVVDYTIDDVTRGGSTFDVVLDLVGDKPLAAMRRVLAPKGMYIASFGSGGKVLGPMPRLLGLMALAPFVSHRLRPLLATPKGDELAELGAMVAAGTLDPVIEQTRPLSETADAIRFVEEHHARGKFVLTVDRG
ncbi:NAD(P)-dependent alcohol dehydrogenase [Phytohabitans sp. ZYX-F-186]|uniref:NAD(P)-dependent alcohol dehydrogenase n=1 Tax=Phytohabitans maris TaxID=3071409 RepID=A0ABU0ZBL6_9ACTN|nr:NAD(P)-dependent alcohol dehydrogenase [Phytohabitans sp. ZYX-F-186]MDQ7904458.1 NAD(P)-dependent alcohol dehydrogenase [Phytohabitans sp. ZYX-F-186]